jgi:hypothetical protein
MYDFTMQGGTNTSYTSSDLCLRAAHLFDFKTIKDAATMKSPLPIVWVVSSDGKLLGMTYIPDQNVNAWHQHETDGEFESCACVAEGTEDHLYVVVKRKLRGATVRTIERMASFQYPSLTESFFVDCGGVYDGEPVSTIYIPWLEGKKVSILADGAVMPQQVVRNGRITLEKECSHVVVGLPYTADMRTLPMTLQSPGSGSGTYKNVSKAFLRVYRSSGILAGPSFEELKEYKQRTTEPPGTAPAEVTGEVTLFLSPSWTRTGEVCVRQADPLPLHLLSAAFEVST